MEALLVSYISPEMYCSSGAVQCLVGRVDECQPVDHQELEGLEGKKLRRKMSSRRVDRASIFAILLIVASALSVFTAGGRALVAQEKNQKEYSTAAQGEGATSSGEAHPRNLMVRTNDYGRYDPSPAFSKPRFKLIPN